MSYGTRQIPPTRWKRRIELGDRPWFRDLNIISSITYYLYIVDASIITARITISLVSMVSFLEPMVVDRPGGSDRAGGSHDGEKCPAKFLTMQIF